MSISPEALGRDQRRRSERSVVRPRAKTTLADLGEAAEMLQRAIEAASESATCGHCGYANSQRVRDCEHHLLTLAQHFE
jgi:hypothetical protein